VLLNTLRGKSHFDFAIRGGHATLTQVELPSWLPEEITSEILNIFKGHLISEITKMTERQLKRKFKKHQRKGSGQSQNISDNDRPRPSFDSLFSEDESDDD
jgi:hypothetical protein